MLTIGSLFAGIGGLELGLEMAGLGPVLWQVESEPFCRRVLAKHWPEANRSVTDVRTAGRRNLDQVDLICGGFPCPDVSSAGAGVGITGDRSGLWFEFKRIVWDLGPQWASLVMLRYRSCCRRLLLERGMNASGSSFLLLPFDLSPMESPDDEPSATRSSRSAPR